MYISVLLNHRAKNCWKGQSSINVIFCQTDEFTEKAKDDNKKKFGVQKEKIHCYDYFSSIEKALTGWRTFENKQNAFYPESFCPIWIPFLTVSRAVSIPKNSETHHTYWLWLPSCVCLRYSYDISLPFPNQWASSEQTQKYLSKAHSDQGPTQSISQMAGPEISSDHKARWYGIFKTSAF